MPRSNLRGGFWTVSANGFSCNTWLDGKQKQHYVQQVQLLTSRPPFKHLQSRFASWVVGKSGPKHILPNGVLLLGGDFHPTVGRIRTKNTQISTIRPWWKTYQLPTLSTGSTSNFHLGTTSGHCTWPAQNSKILCREIETGRATGHHLLERKARLKRVSPIFKEVRALSSSKRKHFLFLMVVDFYQNQGIFLRKAATSTWIYRFQVLNIAALLSGENHKFETARWLPSFQGGDSFWYFRDSPFSVWQENVLPALKKYWVLPKHCNNGPWRVDKGTALKWNSDVITCPLLQSLRRPHKKQISSKEHTVIPP